MTLGKIVQVRGASGSGKTSLVRGIISDLTDRGQTPVRVRYKKDIDSGRRKPSALWFPAVNLLIIGHYDVTCGGCDTIKSRSRPYEIARMAASDGANVLMEGLFLSVEYHPTVALAADDYVRHDVILDVPLPFCVAAVNARRAAEGKEPKQQVQMEAFHKRIVQTYDRLNAVGIVDLHLYRENDPDWTRTLAGDHVRALLELPGGDFSNPDRDEQ